MDVTRKPKLRSKRNDRQGRAWLALVAVLLFAVCWQSFVTQTHRHYEAGAVSAAASVGIGGSAADNADKQSPSRLPDNCPLCREVAHAGPVLIPAQIEVAAPVAAPVLAVVSVPASESFARRSHLWRSRAPPHQLQA